MLPNCVPNLWSRDSVACAVFARCAKAAAGGCSWCISLAPLHSVLLSDVQILAKSYLEREWNRLFEALKLRTRRSVKFDMVDVYEKSTDLDFASSRDVFDMDDLRFWLLVHRPVYRIAERAIIVLSTYLRLVIATNDIAALCKDNLHKRTMFTFERYRYATPQLIWCVHCTFNLCCRASLYSAALGLFLERLLTVHQVSVQTLLRWSGG